MLSHIKKLSIAGLAVLTVIALGIAACGDDDGADADSGADSAALEEQVTKTQVLAALTAFRVEQLHEFNMEVTDASEIDPGWAGKTDRLQRVAASVTWPDELHDLAGEMMAGIEAMQAALDAESLSDFKGATTDAHDAWHELEHEAYPYIAGEESSQHTAEEEHG